ncbi:HNH endonuclease [Sphingorhabdus sp.]|uniref:HNH endonuclease n=1 Tax=Sphingorhabdus sp. TaxID=1902408 RepID=UPI0035AF477A|nr:HNH endonuclease [Sphingomonadaceae bacterium]
MNAIQKSDILQRISEFDQMGETAFLQKYAGGRGSVTTWIVHEGNEYPIKAIWASAHQPPIAPRSFKTNDCEPQIRAMGFKLRKQEKTLNPSTDSFSGFCGSLGFPLKNIRWSWCAIGQNGTHSLFTVWDNEILPDGQTYEFSNGGSDELRTDAGAREFRRILNETIDNDLVAYGIKCSPVYPLTIPRKRQKFDRKSLLALRIRRDGERIVGTIVGTVPCDAILAGFTTSESAIDDLDPIGSDQPGRAAYTGTFIVRDERVRQAVITRAHGRCEYCGELGFKKADGSHYVEAHHIISLAKQGPDTLKNVIAVCPNHHREAHFGENREQLESEFKAILAKLQGN